MGRSAALYGVLWASLAGLVLTEELIPQSNSQRQRETAENLYKVKWRIFIEESLPSQVKSDIKQLVSQKPVNLLTHFFMNDPFCLIMGFDGHVEIDFKGQLNVTSYRPFNKDQWRKKFNDNLPALNTGTSRIESDDKFGVLLFRDRLPEEDPFSLGWQIIKNGVSLITVYASHNGEGIDIESLATTTIHEMIHAAGIHDHQTSNNTVTLQSWAVNEIKHPLIIINTGEMKFLLNRTLLNDLKTDYSDETNFKCRPRPDPQNLKDYEVSYIKGNQTKSLKNLPFLKFNFDTPIMEPLFLFYCAIMFVMVLSCLCCVVNLCCKC